MKWIYRLFTVAILGGAMLLPFFINNHEGKPMFSIPEAGDLVPSALTSGQDNSPLPSISTSQTFYKWQDENGTWHYGDAPPAKASGFSTIEIDSNTNVIQSIPSADEPPPASNVNQVNTSPDTSTSVGNVLSLDRAMNVLQDAQKVQGLMDNHNAQLEAINSNNTQ